jgi:PhzF family phenazine biosynthesis protein
MTLDLYQIDAFTDKLFKGNPAAVVPLDKWLDEELMQNIATENNLAETAFICPDMSEAVDFDIRWFTPLSEINLCGHATLASAYVLFNIMDFHKDEISLSCKSGILKVWKEGDMIWMDFPSWQPERYNDYPAELQQALGGAEIVGVYKHRDLLVELLNEEAVRKCEPDFALINKTGHNVIITAPGKEADFVSRFFAPTVGINEDPVTGSAHSQLIPFWSDKLGKEKLSAQQLSQRGGVLSCEQKGDRVLMGGNCVFYMKGEISM